MWTYHEPAKLIFGVGAAENLNSEMEALGVTKAVLMSSRSIFRQGIPQQLAELTGGKIVAISTEVEPDPTVENVDHAAALARQNGADCVIGLGGGSVIDCAKATAAAVAEDLTASARDYRDVHGVTCLLKSDRSVIAGNDGSLTRTEAGTPALAKGGTGDVLTGIIAGLICLGLGEAEAAAFGSFLHALCGRRAAEKLSVHGVLAREVAEEIPGAKVAVLSGPSHAEEVSRGIPTTGFVSGEKKLSQWTGMTSFGSTFSMVSGVM